MCLEATLKRLQIDMEEMKATFTTPRNELNAPLVGQRDFVRTRLMLDLQIAEQELVASEQALRKAQERFDVRSGVASHRDAGGSGDCAAARERMQKLLIYLELRKKYLRREIKAEELRFLFARRAI